MTPTPDEKKKRALEALYRGMPTVELQRRIRGGQLIASAQIVAQAELQSRTNPAPAVAAKATTPIVAVDDDDAHDDFDEDDEDEDDAQARMWRAVGGVLVCTVLAGWLLPPALAALVLLMVVPWIFVPFAKAFPKIGLTLGLLFAGLPVGLSVRAWTSGALSMRGGDYKPVGALMAWFALLVAFALCWSLASALISGARHRGSWSGLHRRLAKMRESQIEAILK